MGVPSRFEPQSNFRPIARARRRSLSWVGTTKHMCQPRHTSPVAGLIAVILVLGFAWMKAVGLQTIGLGYG